MAHVCIELEGTGRDGKGITITITRGHLGSSRAQPKQGPRERHGVAPLPAGMILLRTRDT